MNTDRPPWPSQLASFLGSPAGRASIALVLVLLLGVVYNADGSFFHLDAPIVRVSAPDTPVPYSPPLEYDFLPKVEQVVEAARRLTEI